MRPEIAPRWALCSDCRIEGQATCPDEPQCWHPMKVTDLAVDEPPNSWMVQHFVENPTHTVQETLDQPPHCLTCGDKSPAWFIKRQFTDAKPATD